MGITLNRRNLDRYAERLANDFPVAARAATAKALNRTAKGAILLARKDLVKRFVMRNKFTLGSLRSTRTPPSRAIDSQFTKAGSISTYLALQEKGGALKDTPEGRRVTTSRGSREGPRAKPRRKLATGQMANRNINLQGKRQRRGTSKRKAMIAVKVAQKKGQRFIYLRLKNDKVGYFRVLKKEIRMVHVMLQRTARIKPTPWLQPAADKARRLAPAVFHKELERRLRF